MAKRQRDNNAEMPFLDHLEELRWRIIYALGALVVAFGLAFWVVLQFDVVGKLAEPMIKVLGHPLMYTHPMDSFTITLNAALTLGLILASPVILYQIWAFLAPGLYKKERRVAIGTVIAGAFLFASGAALAYWGVLPLALPWLYNFGSKSLMPMIMGTEYFGFVFIMVLTFGVAFELPLLILALAAIGLVTPQFLNKYRRHAIVLIVIVAAFFTPGDLVLTTLALAIPLYALFELSVLGTYIIHRNRQRRMREAQTESPREPQDEPAEPERAIKSLM
jgi:sec-independent protein translocase protein TatC